LYNRGDRGVNTANLYSNNPTIERQVDPLLPIAELLRDLRVSRSAAGGREEDHHASRALGVLAPGAVDPLSPVQSAQESGVSLRARLAFPARGDRQPIRLAGRAEQIMIDILFAAFAIVILGISICERAYVKHRRREAALDRALRNVLEQNP
jgi:hypothetical protein